MKKQVYKASKFAINQEMIEPQALNVIKKLQKHGFAAYIVGGGVRDILLGKKPKDFDVVSDAPPEKIYRIFGRNCMIIGRRFKIVHIYSEHLDATRSEKYGRPFYIKHIVEVSTLRTNKINQHTLSEHGRILVDNNYGSKIDEDASRRDFTVNALYYDPIAETIIDYHDGINDLKQLKLKIIGSPYERFLEDPVRILRAIRLSEKLGLEIDHLTALNFMNSKALLANEPSGRLFEEMLKLLLSGYSRAVIQQLIELQLPKGVFPLFDQLFFGENPESFAWAILAKTDERILQGEDVSAIFILSGLMWTLVYNQYLQKSDDQVAPRQTLLDITLGLRKFCFQIGMTRHFYTLLCDVWLLQIDFEFPTTQNIDKLISNSRFRQAWHLYHLRADFGQVDKTIYQWWERFMQANESDKTKYLIEFVDLFEPTPKKKRSRHRRKSSTKKSGQINTKSMVDN